jgi:hypothetical protein
MPGLVVGGAFVVAAPRVPAVAFAAVVMLVLAIAIEARERRAERLPKATAAWRGGRPGGGGLRALPRPDSAVG